MKSSAIVPLCTQDIFLKQILLSYQARYKLQVYYLLHYSYAPLLKCNILSLFFPS